MIPDNLAIVVLGVHRSGTSVMTHVLSLCGYTLPTNILLPKEDNTNGFWESSVIVDLNDEILSIRDAIWHEVFPPDDDALLSNSFAACLEKAERAIESEFANAPRIVLKDPRLSILTAFWKLALERQGYRSAFILMVRNPIEVATSLARRDGFSLERGLLLWLTNMLSAERKSRDNPRLFVTYERLLEDVRGVLDDVETTIGETLPRRTRTAELEIERALDPDLRHHIASHTWGLRGELGDMVTTAYTWFQASARGDKPDTKVLDQVAARLKSCEDVVGGVLAEFRAEPARLALALEESKTKLAQVVAALEAEQAQSGERAQNYETARSDIAKLKSHIEAMGVETTQALTVAREKNELMLESEQRRGQQLEDELSSARSALEVERVEGERLRGEVRTTQKRLDAAAQQVEEVQARLDIDRTAAELKKAESDLQRLTLIRHHQEEALRNERILSTKLQQRITLVEANLNDARRKAAGPDGHGAHVPSTEWRTVETLSDRLRMAHDELAELSRKASSRQQSLLEKLDVEKRRADTMFAAANAHAETIAYFQSRAWWKLITAIKKLLH